MSYEPPEIVRRAEAILGQQAPGQAPGKAGAPGGGAGALADLPGLHQRALALVNDLFATLGAGGGGRPPAGLPGGLPLPVTSLPWLPGLPGAAGQRLQVPLTVDNPLGRPLELGLYSTDLLSDAGRSIPAHLVSFDPPRLTLGPGERAGVTARIDVPLQTIPGAYSGLVQAVGLPASKTVITIEIR